jgi:acyl carrier protein
MNTEDVAKTVIDLINSTLMDPLEIKLESRLVEDLDLDSIGFVELGTGLEDKYMIDIPDDLLQKLKTVEDVVNTVLTCPTYATA